MTTEQVAVFAVLIGALVLFVWGRWRYDVVALAALLVSVAIGIVPAEDAFVGFGEPVVTTVAAVLVLSAAIRRSGLLETVVARIVSPLRTPDRQVGALAGLVALFSAFMNNVGALAMFLPVAIHAAGRAKRSPSELLMPLAFASLLGGLVTLIGTPPNLLIASVRRSFTGEPFRMFDFTPVGLGVATVGILFLTFGWRLIPRGRRGQVSPEERFRIQDYVTELRVPADSPASGMTVGAIEALGEGDLTVIGVVRNEFRRLAPAESMTVRAGDVLVVESDPATLKRAMDAAGLELVGSKELATSEPAPSSEGIGVAEAVVTADSPLLGHSPVGVRLRSRFGVNLLAVRRQGRPIVQRLGRLRLQAGDVVVLQGELERMPDILAALGCLPLAERNLQLGRPRYAYLPLAILAAAVGLSAAGVAPIAITFLGAVLVIAVARIMTLGEIYGAIDWPILVLLGAMIPVTQAFHDTGGTTLIADWLGAMSGGAPAPAVLALVLVTTMLVTPLLNNAATVLLMAPIAATLAGRLDLSMDPFLMAVAIGASCDFLTPIGHQSNTLVMGPGGYRFGDYWRLGLPLSILVAVTAVPLILLVWPLR